MNHMSLFRFYAAVAGLAAAAPGHWSSWRRIGFRPGSNTTGSSLPLGSTTHAEEGGFGRLSLSPSELFFDFDLVLHAGDRSSGCRGQEVGVGHVVNADVPRRARCQGVLLSDEQLELLDEKGYLILPAALDPASIDALRSRSTN